MLVIVTRTTDTADACNVGGPVHTRTHTWTIEHAALEQHLKSEGQYVRREVIGVEVRDR